MRLRVLPLADILTFIVLPGLFVAFLAVGSWRALGALTRWDIVLAWSVCFGWAVLSGYRLSLRMDLSNLLRYRTCHGLQVGWTRPKYAVARSDVERATQALLEVVAGDYPGAAAAITDCFVVFREPVWHQLTSGRRVSGEQDNRVLMVGWDPHVEHTALQHELAHRVLQVCAGDPGRDEAHRIISSYGL